MSTASTASVAVTPPVTMSDRWTRYNVTVLTICILGFAVDRLFRLFVERVLARYMSYVSVT